VDAEAQVRKATGDAETRIKAAEAELFESKARADAALYLQLKDAEGNKAKLEAMAAGLQRVREAVGGSSEALLQYMMIEKNVYGELAAKNAEAVRGMQPKITVWSTGTDAAASGAPGKTIADVFKLLPPLAATISEQTGIKPPSWLMTMPAEVELPAASASAIAKRSIEQGVTVPEPETANKPLV
jgi:flotillin